MGGNEVLRCSGPLIQFIFSSQLPVFVLWYTLPLFSQQQHPIKVLCLEDPRVQRQEEIKLVVALFKLF